MLEGLEKLHAFGAACCAKHPHKSHAPLGQLRLNRKSQCPQRKSNVDANAWLVADFISKIGRADTQGSKSNTLGPVHLPDVVE